MFDWIRRFLFGGTGSDAADTEGGGAKMYRDIESVDRLIDESGGGPVLVFKHSSACPISTSAKGELDRWLEDNPDREIYLVVVQQRRDISNELEEKLGVLHETPQLLLLESGKAVQHWSHNQIRGEHLEEALG
ncbi:MAG: bacillithiol system redox-active protein YtxJ [Candidatus Glassbacteria bacterium]|nr:bacillithiol system redox-active protein YtxJ [Candidatus Glassbacteria bacterium]